MNKNVLDNCKNRVNFKLIIIDEKYLYKDKVNENIPFPCNSFYDAKAWKWLKENIKDMNRDFLFWNIGG